GLFAAVRDLVSLTGLLATVYLLAPAMALILVCSAAPVFFAQLSLSRRFAGMLDTMSASSRRQFQLTALTSDVRAVKEIRLFGLVDFFRERVLSTIVATNSAQRDLDRRQLRVQAALAALGSVIGAGGLAWAVFAASRGRLSIGDVSAFVTAIAAAQAALSGLVTKIS
ncbi:ABC transporter transmembrane domain-containing protein, partial [Nocardia gipuzkoensis]